MAQTLLIAGLGCLVAAIVGGGLTAFQVQLPALQSPVRQVLLATLGLILIGFSFFLFYKPGALVGSAPGPAPTPAPANMANASPAPAVTTPTAPTPQPTASTSPLQPTTAPVAPALPPPGSPPETATSAQTLVPDFSGVWVAKTSSVASEKLGWKLTITQKGDQVRIGDQMARVELEPNGVGHARIMEYIAIDADGRGHPVKSAKEADRVNMGIWEVKGSRLYEKNTIENPRTNQLLSVLTRIFERVTP